MALVPESVDPMLVWGARQRFAVRDDVRSQFGLMGRYELRERPNLAAVVQGKIKRAMASGDDELAAFASDVLETVIDASD